MNTIMPLLKLSCSDVITQSPITLSGAETAAVAQLKYTRKELLSVDMTTQLCLFRFCRLRLPFSGAKARRKSYSGPAPRGAIDRR